MSTVFWLIDRRRSRTSWSEHPPGTLVITTSHLGAEASGERRAGTGC
jgi:hypothetical protein